MPATAGRGSATLRGIGVGRFTGPGAISWRGAVLYETQTPELSRLDGTAAVFEYEVDESSKSEGRLYEWK